MFSKIKIQITTHTAEYKKRTEKPVKHCPASTLPKRFTQRGSNIRGRRISRNWRYTDKNLTTSFFNIPRGIELSIDDLFKYADEDYNQNKLEKEVSDKKVNESNKILSKIKLRRYQSIKKTISFDEYKSMK